MVYSYKKPSAEIFSSIPHQASSFDKISSNEAMMLKNIPLQSSFSPLPQEGIWQPIPETLFPHDVVLAKTFIRPDPQRSYAIVSLVKMDMKKLGIGAQAGTYYPGGTHGVWGSGYVPKNIQQSNSLLAVFNGGFQEKDGHYGMIVGKKTYVPLRKDIPLFILYKDGSSAFADYTGQTIPASAAAIRQNGPYLIHDGEITQYIEQGPDTWGRTTTNSMYTWRSGIGVTKNGNLIYAVGNSLIPQTLAKAFKDPGAVTAIQLDINPYWVRFILYNSVGNGNYSYYPLLNNMHNGGSEYLHKYNKDFFYVYKK